MSLSAVDLERNRASRRQGLEREAEHLRRHRDQLERMLALCVRVATGGTSTSPLALLALLEELDERTNQPSAERTIRVLQETS